MEQRACDSSFSSDASTSLLVGVICEVEDSTTKLCGSIERLFSMGAGILTAKRFSLSSDNFQKASFFKGNLDFLKFCDGNDDSANTVNQTSHEYLHLFAVFVS